MKRGSRKTCPEKNSIKIPPSPLHTYTRPRLKRVPKRRPGSCARFHHCQPSLPRRFVFQKWRRVSGLRCSRALIAHAGAINSGGAHDRTLCVAEPRRNPRGFWATPPCRRRLSLRLTPAAAHTTGRSAPFRLLRFPPPLSCRGSETGHHSRTQGPHEGICASDPTGPPGVSSNAAEDQISDQPDDFKSTLCDTLDVVLLPSARRDFAAHPVNESLHRFIFLPCHMPKPHHTTTVAVDPVETPCTSHWCNTLPKPRREVATRGAYALSQSLM